MINDYSVYFHLRPKYVIFSANTKAGWNLLGGWYLRNVNNFRRRMIICVNLMRWMLREFHSTSYILIVAKIPYITPVHIIKRNSSRLFLHIPRINWITECLQEIQILNQNHNNSKNCSFTVLNNNINIWRNFRILCLNIIF